ncbi:hypothetical protein TWF696_001439 [Orbilia brochopaga]|uniref:Uncharacterized protein n=1 Tax=Orbilia brochopaga TaxID=3140254 RepID=A0AAV9U9F6_9PEZI
MNVMTGSETALPTAVAPSSASSLDGTGADAGADATAGTDANPQDLQNQRQPADADIPLGADDDDEFATEFRLPFVLDPPAGLPVDADRYHARVPMRLFDSRPLLRRPDILSGISSDPGIGVAVAGDLITEQEISKTYLAGRLAQVSYGTYRGQSAAVIVLDFVFHTADRKRHRFRTAEIDVKFERNDSTSAAERIVHFGPQFIQGEIKVEHVYQVYEASVNLSPPSSPVSVEIAASRATKFTQDRRLTIQGTARGDEPSRIVWTLEERKGDSVPPEFKVAFMVLHPPGVKFTAIVSARGSIGFTLNPLRLEWPGLFRGREVGFHESRPTGNIQIHPLLDVIDLERLCRV